MLEELKNGLKEAFDRLLNRGADERAIREFVIDLQRALIRADVNVRIVLDFSKKVEEDLKAQSSLPGISFKELAVKVVYDRLVEMLGGDYELKLGPKNVIILVGIQGSGKTTFAAKLANYLMKKGYSVGLVEADTYRPGAYEQLKQLADRFGCEVYGQGNDPVEIAVQGLKAFKDRPVVIIDTAGRHREEQGLMKEVEELSRAISPTLSLLVIDATIGQQAYYQAKAFADAVKVGGLVITKLDGSAKGGGALAAAAATGAKVYFISDGERLEDIEEFRPVRFVKRLLGIGDLEGLIERVNAAQVRVSQEEAKRVMSGRMTLEDFLEQMDQMAKVGPLEKVFEMLPLPVKVDKKEIERAKAQMKKWRAIILSMTPEERRNPKIINTPRIRRIAAGSGTTERDVKELLDSFERGKSLIKSARRMRLGI